MRDVHVLAASILAVFVAYCVWWATNDPHHLSFWTKAKTHNFLKTDPDGYMHRLTKADLSARKAASNDDYIYWSAHSAPAEFSELEKYKLKQACRRADAFFASIRTETSYFHKHNSKLPWVFARVKGAYYEGGLPHTRRDAIFLTDGAMRRSLKELMSSSFTSAFMFYSANSRKRRARCLKKLASNTWEKRAITSAPAPTRTLTIMCIRIRKCAKASPGLPVTPLITRQASKT